MEFIVDIQGFRDNGDHFIIKEIAAYTFAEGSLGHWIISSPYTFSTLGDKAQSQNNWLSAYYHGLEWSDGDIPFMKIQEILQNIGRSASLIYAKGLEKAAILQEIMGRPVINMDLMNCPSLKSVALNVQAYCIHHSTLFKGTKKSFICALDNVARLRSWLISNRRRLIYDEQHSATSISVNSTDCCYDRSLSSRSSADEDD